MGIELALGRQHLKLMNAEQEAVGKETVEKQLLSRRKSRKVLFHVEEGKRRGE